MEVSNVLFSALVFVLAGCVKGVTGMGLPTVAVSLLSLRMSPMEAAGLLVAPSLLTNLWQCRGPHLVSLIQRLWPGWLAIALSTIVVSLLVGASPGRWARVSLGVTLLLYGAWGLRRPKLPDLSGAGPWPGAAIGAMTGLVTGITAVFVLPWVPYLQALRLEKDAMVQALGLSFTVSTLALAVSLPASSLPDIATGGVVTALGGALLGLRVGAALRARLSGSAFQRALCLIFIVLGLANVFR